VHSNNSGSDGIVLTHDSDGVGAIDNQSAECAVGLVAGEKDRTLRVRDIVD